MRLWSRGRLPLVMVALLLAVVAPLSTAAQSEIVITVAVPQFFSQLITPELLEAFSAENPGIRAKVVDGGFPGFASPIDGLDAHLSDVSDYVSSADVVFASSDNFSVEATRAGYILDLTPLTSADPTLNSDDFIPAAWQSVQWDNGVWALPVSVDVITLVYDPEKFDAAGVAYPDSSWTIDELANAARQLAEYDANNAVSTPGLVMFGNYAGLIARSLMGTSLVDSNAVPDMPDFSDPGLASILTTLNDLQTEGVVASSFNGNIDDVPMRIIGSFGLTSFDPNTPASPSVMLPGGAAGLDVQGFAISSGTQYPEAAYALAKFLTQRAEVGSNFFGAAPARQSLRGLQPETSDGGGPGGGAVFIGRPNSPEIDAAIDAALVNALPASELRYAAYLNSALSSMSSDGLDAATALQDAEATAVSNLTAAAELRAETAVIVATPVPDVVLSEGEISLKFGMQSFISPLPNQDQWDQVISDFVANDPQVGNVELVAGFNTDPMDSDCYYLPYNNVPEVDLNTVLSLDPYLDADPTFDRNDLVGSVMTQVQRDNKTWALPIVIQPEALRYNSEVFDQAGVAAPENGWTVDSFADTLRQLKDYLGEAPFASQGFGGTYMLLLIASYGGLPVDYRTSPPTLNFTDPATVEAIRQVLDLAKEGLIDYQELAAEGGAIFIAGASAEDDRPAIYTQSNLGVGDISIQIGGPQSDPYRTTTYPMGNTFNAITYGVGTAYISATTQNADACYRWLSTLSQHMELFSGMPARRSQMNDASRTADEISFYTQIDALMSDPNTVEFPSAFRGASPASFLQLRWLEQVFDNYVLNDADLETELAEAQLISQTFQECVAGIPAFDPATDDQRGYFQQFGECARLADPEMGSLFGG
ncbi:MAG: extracellular solute-binding protein [Anaerolineae bacterium]|nr:extracellular solute-binding protein [Anaerolineae bacterium]